MLDVAIRADVRGFDLEIAFQTQNGEILTLFGPSGTGKSMTLRLLAGLHSPVEGHIILDGRVLFDAAAGVDVPPRARRMGYVPQNYALFPHLNVAENIAYGLADLTLDEQRARVGEMVQIMRLRGMEARRPAHLSGGQQQRVALARALATEPEVLLLDEPFAALDDAIRGRLQNELLALQRRLDIPLLLVTHDLAEAYALGDRLAVYDVGRLLQVGPKDDVLRRPTSRIAARFVGTKNIFDGMIVDSDRDGITIAWGGQGETVYSVQATAGQATAGQATAGQAPGAHRGDGSSPSVLGQRLVFCIRPEEIRVVKPDQPLRPSLRENLVSGRLVREIARGAMHTLFLKVDGLSARDYDLEVLLPHPAWQGLGLSLGGPMTVSLRKSAIHVMAKRE